MGPSVEGYCQFVQMVFAPLNKMAAMPVYNNKNNKTIKIFFSRTKKALRLNLGTVYSIKDQVCSNDDPRMTFDLLTARSNLHPHTFVWGKY